MIEYQILKLWKNIDKYLKGNLLEWCVQLQQCDLLRCLTQHCPPVCCVETGVKRVGKSILCPPSHSSLNTHTLLYTNKHKHKHFHDEKKKCQSLKYINIHFINPILIYLMKYKTLWNKLKKLWFILSHKSAL